VSNEGPTAGTIDAWAWDYVRTTDLRVKLEPPPVPSAFDPEPTARRVAAPGRPPELEVTPRALRQKSLKNARGRAALLHKFLHHELQAAELMAWALLAWPETPEAFRRGLVRILLDEVRHMNMYRAHIERLGFAVGGFPVRDWFWERVPACQSPVEFVAVMGMGLEAANLDHAARFEAELNAVGDAESAATQALVGREERAHVRFAVEWFRKWTGGLSFDEWSRSLPEPLSPLFMRGRPFEVRAREASGMDAEFLEALAAWQPRGF
jgi:uncharacterized ferritin-like protein (DUF455 family)